MLIKKLHISFFLSDATLALGFLIGFSHCHFIPRHRFPTAKKATKLPEIFLRTVDGIIQKTIPWWDFDFECLHMLQKVAGKCFGRKLF